MTFAKNIKSNINTKALRITFILSAVLIVIFSGYFLYYIPGQKEFLTKRNFRVLKEYSAQITKAYNNNSTIINNVVSSEFIGDVNKLGTGEIFYSDAIFDQLMQISDAEFFGYTDNAIDSIITELVSTDFINSINDVLLRSGNFEAIDLDINFLAKDTTNKYFFSQKTMFGGESYFIENKIDLFYNNLRLEGKIRLNLDSIISPIVDRDIFDEILLVSNHDVIFSKGHDEISSSFIDLNIFNNVEGKKIKDEDSFFEKQQETKKQNLKLEQFYTTTYNNIEIANTRYTLYTQPIKVIQKDIIADHSKKGYVTTVDSSMSQNWILCGLVEEEKLNKEASQISLHYIAVFSILILIVLVCWPFFKIWSLGPNDRLRISDIKFLIFSTLLSTALITLSLLDFSYYGNLNEKLDQQLKSFATTISNSFNRELEATLEQLIEFNSKLGDDWQISDTPEKKYSKVLADQRCFDPTSKNKFIESIAWIDSSGKQKYKWTTKSFSTPLINVANSKRKYFYEHLNNRAWIINGHKFYIESIYSSTTDKNEAILSVPLELGQHQNLKVAAIAYEPKSMIDPIIPNHFGFAVLNEHGKVLFHSDQNRNLRENFLTECNENTELIAALHGRTEMWTKANYYGTDYKIYSRPLENVPWTIITFRNLRTIRSSNLEMLSTSLILFGAFLIILFIIFLIVRLIFWSSKAEWIWPQKCNSPAYAILIFSLFLFLIISFFFVLILEFYSLIYAGLFIPLAAIFLFYFLVKTFQNPNETPAKIFFFRMIKKISILEKVLNKTNRDCKKSFVVALFLLGILSSFIPSIFFFKFSVQFENDLLFKHVQYELGKKWEKRNQKLASLNLNPNIHADIKNNMIKEFVSKDFYDLNFSFFFDTKILDSSNENYINWNRDSTSPPTFSVELKEGPQELNPVEKLINRFITHSRPNYSYIIKKTRGMAPPESIDKRWISIEYSDIAKVHKMDSAADSAKKDITKLNIKISEDDLEKRLSAYKHILLYRDKNNSHYIIASLPFGMFDKISAAAILGLIFLSLIFTFGLYNVIKFVWNRIMFIENPGESLLLSDELNNIINNDNVSAIDKKPGNYIFIPPPFSQKSEIIDKFLVFQNNNIVDKDKKIINLDIPQLINEGSISEYAAKNLAYAKHRMIILDHFERPLLAIENYEKLLNFLESLLYKNSSSVIVIISASEPMQIIIDVLESEHPDADKIKRKLYLDRWSKILTEFERKFISAPKLEFNLHQIFNGLPVSKNLEEIKSLLVQEYCINTKIQSIILTIAKKIQKKSTLPSQSKNEPYEYPTLNKIMEDIEFLAEPYYRILWSSLTKIEKLVLIQLAEDGLGNYNNSHVIRLLIHKGLVEVSPVRIMNESFKRFILKVKKPEDILFEGTKSNWNTIRVPLFIGIIAIAIFLFTTQKELFNYTIGILSAIVAIIPLITRVLTSVPIFKSRDS